MTGADRHDAPRPGGDGAAVGRAGAGLWHSWGYRLGQLPGGEVQLCAACRTLGRCRLGMTREWLDDEGSLHARLACPADHDAAPGGVAHGGWVASALDEILGHTPVLQGHLAVTATLTVHFIRPAPIERPMVGRAWVVRRDGLRWHLAGELRLEATNALIARAEGQWAERDGSHYDRFQDWLQTQDGAGPSSPTGDGRDQSTRTGRPAAST